MKSLLGGDLLALVSSPMFASQVCPVATLTGTTNIESVSGSYIGDLTGQNDEGCNVLITFNSDGSITTTNPNAAISYDAGNDDNLIGIVNNTGSAITSVVLNSAANDIHGFDGDGICEGYGFTAPGPTTGCANTDSSKYGGPFVTYTNITNGNEDGTVNFGNGGIAASGGSTWFSLEGPVDLTLTVNGNPVGAPEPASMALIGGGLSALYFARRRKA